MYVEVAERIARNFRIGQAVEVVYPDYAFDKRGNTKARRRGIVRGVYGKHILVDYGKYKESFTYVDMAIGVVNARVAGRRIA